MPEPTPTDEPQQPKVELTTIDRTEGDDGDFTVTFTLRPRQS